MSTHYTEQEYYNAVTIHCRGAYKQIAALRSAHNSWQATYESLPSKDSDYIRIASEALTASGIRVVLRDDPDFPEPLRHIPWPPHAIYVRGKLPHNWERVVAMVGTRKATPVGIRFAHDLGKALATHNIVVVSGLALGIDAASHEGVVASKGVAVAVLASGLDAITPRTNHALAQSILDHGGCLISEYPIGTESLPHLFLERNRIVSGLAKAILVIEAPSRSGTLATARFAVEQNKDVFVVPGGVTHPNYEGSHELIKQGASLLTKVEDITEYFGILSPPLSAVTRTEQYSEVGEAILQYLTKAGVPVHTDALYNELDFSQPAIAEALGLLAISGAVQENGGKYYV